MKDKDLVSYLDTRVNRWASLTGGEVITLPLTSSEVDMVVDHLNGDLSPENLHCDGEITRAQADRKYRFYMRVTKQLEQHAGHTVNVYG